MTAVPILFNCAAILLFIFSMLISLTMIILIIYRFYFNVQFRRQPDSRYRISPFDDNTCLLSIGNIYLITFFYTIAWISLLLRTFLGDFQLFTDLFDLGDSILCRIQVGIIFFSTSALYHGFFIQALSRYIKVLVSNRLDPIMIGSMPINSILIHSLMIISSWIMSFIVLIPAYTSFQVFSYIAEQYHCLITFTNIRGFTYALLICYIMPMLPITCMYLKVIGYLNGLPHHGVLLQTLRGLTVRRQILKLCILMVFLGAPTIFFLFQFFLTQHLHPMTDRLHALGMSINSVILCLGYAKLNSLGELFPQYPSIHERTLRIQPRASSSL